MCYLFSEILSIVYLFLKSIACKEDHLFLRSTFDLPNYSSVVIYPKHLSGNGLSRETNPADTSAPKHRRSSPFFRILSLINYVL